MGIALGSITLTCVNDGETGNGILSTVIDYCPGISPTEAPGDYLTDQNGVLLQDENGKYLVDGIWSETVPIVPPGYYLWTRTTITYDDGKQTVSYSVSKEGITIVTEERQYYLSTSYTTLDGGEWTTMAPYHIPEGLYLWGRFKFTMSDGSVQYSTAVYENTISGIINKTNANERNILMKIWETDIKSAITDYDTLDATTSIRDRIVQYQMTLDGITSIVGDTTSINRSISYHLTQVSQTADKIYWLVEDGSTSSSVQLTSNAMNFISENINLNGKVTFDSFETATKNSLNNTATAANNANSLSQSLNNVITEWSGSSSPTQASTLINGGYIQTHTIDTEKLNTNAIKSLGTWNTQKKIYENGYSRKGNATYSTKGSLFDLQYGNIFTPSFSVINTVPSGETLTVGAYFDGHVTAKTLTVGTNSSLSIQQGTVASGSAGIGIANGTLRASNAEIYGTIYAGGGTIGGWNIGTDILYYSSNTPSSTSMILKPGGVTSSTSIGGSTGSNTWAFTIKDVFGVRTDGYMFTTKGKIGGFTIDASKLYNGTNSLSSTTTGVYLGTDGIRNYSGTNQYVNITGGKITAYGAEIHGSLYSTDGTIGGLTLKNGAIYKDTNTISSTTAGIYLGTDGFRNYQSGTANVTIKNGVITANGAVIKGEITATKLTLDGIKIPASTGISGLAAVATSGSYNSLTDKPPAPDLTIYMTKDGIPVGDPTEGHTGIKISSAGLLTCANAVVYGKIISAEGKIAGWNLSTTALWKDSNASHTTPQVCSTSMLFSTGTTSSTSVGGSGTSSKTWALTISDKFGVTTGGAMFATSATISGVLTADANSKIGPWTVTSTAIKTGNYNTSGTMYFGSDYGLSIGTQFRVDASGKLYATGADIVSATIGSGTTKINISGGASPSIYYNITSMSSSNASGFYLGSDGIRIGKVYVDSNGNTNLQTGAKIGSNTNQLEIKAISGGTHSAISFGKSTITDVTNTNGVYVGTDGISLGKKLKPGSTTVYEPSFKVTSAGDLYATSATISGTLTAGSGSFIKGGSSIGNWVVDNAGYLKNSGGTVILSPTNDAPFNDGLGTKGFVKFGNFFVNSVGDPSANTYNLTMNASSSLPVIWYSNSGLVSQLCFGFKYSNGAGRWFDVQSGKYVISENGTTFSNYSIVDAVNNITTLNNYKTAITNGTGTISASSITGTTITGTSMSASTLSASTSITTPKLIGDVAVELNSSSTSPLNFSFSDIVRGRTVAKNTDVTLVDNKVYLVIFYHISNNNDCGLYIIRGNFSAVVPIKEASNVDIQYPNGNSDSARKKFRWTCSDSPVCRLEMLQG